MIDMEISLAQGLGWSLVSIDETDIESLLPFIFRLAWQSKNSGSGTNGVRRLPARLAYCDQVEFL